MVDIPKSLRTLRGKYRIAQNVFVCCILHIVEANDHEMQLFLGVKRRRDGQVPVGTRIFLDMEPLNKIKGEKKQSTECLSITVKEVREMDGQQLLICSTLQKESITERRQKERISAEFSLRLADSGAVFTVVDGTDRGLTLRYTSNKPLISLLVDRTYEFIINYKETDYPLSGQIKHIHYDWKAFQHTIGVHFPEPGKEQEVILNLLLDPEYTVKISTNQTVDTSQGKVSIED
jgi:hypothetical protein